MKPEKLEHLSTIQCEELPLLLDQYVDCFSYVPGLCQFVTH